MILTDDDQLADACRGLRNLCFQPGKRFVHERLGWNMRLSNVQAALGLAQLERLDEFIDRKRHMGATYNRLLGDLTALQLPLPATDYAHNTYWVYGIVLKDDVPFDAEDAMRRLVARGIGTRPFFWPMHEQPVLRCMGLFSEMACAVAERLGRRGLYLPSGLSLNEDSQARVVQTLAEELDGS